jgi:hypothetical protein
VSGDPADQRDLKLVPSEDLRDWLRIEKQVKADFWLDGIGDDKRAQRARWASGRIKKIEAELRQRSSRTPTVDP